MKIHSLIFSIKLPSFQGFDLYFALIFTLLVPLLGKEYSRIGLRDSKRYNMSYIIDRLLLILVHNRIVLGWERPYIERAACGPIQYQVAVDHRGSAKGNRDG